MPVPIGLSRSPFEINKPSDRWRPDIDQEKRGVQFFNAPFIDKVRNELYEWRQFGYDGISETSRNLLNSDVKGLPPVVEESSFLGLSPANSLAPVSSLPKLLPLIDSPEMSLQILKVSGPDNLIIAIPHGPLPEDKAKIFISLSLGLQLFW